MKLKELGIIIFCLFMVIAPIIFTLNLFYYIDPINQCIIRIDNKSDLTRQSLNYLKKDNKQDYKYICNNLSKIVETVCINGDWNLYSQKEISLPGCYLKGTKIAYIAPTNSNDENISMLMKFARYSEEYWNSR